MLYKSPKPLEIEGFKRVDFDPFNTHQHSFQHSRVLINARRALKSHARAIDTDYPLDFRHRQQNIRKFPDIPRKIFRHFNRFVYAHSAFSSQIQA